MQSEESRQDSTSSENSGSSDDSQSQSSAELAGSKVADGMDTMQEYYNQMEFGGSGGGVAMPGLDSDNSNSNSLGGFAPAEQQSYAEMMMEIEQGEEKGDEESNNTRDSNASPNPNSESVNGNGVAGAEGKVSEGSESESEQSVKRKLEDVEGSESQSQGATNAGDGDNNDGLNSEAPEGDGPPMKKALLELNVRKLLPDLEKHWKPVEDDPNDFQAWTYLLQYVDQENELLAAREAYDGFLSRYPYCYGYWKKYADYEKRRGSAKDCEQVFRRGLAAISLSVDLWIHYLNYCKAAHEQQPEYIRSQYESAILACGLEFRSDKLWEHYLQWELEVNELKNALALYDRVLSTPSLKYQEHFQSLKDYVQKQSPEEILREEEYTELKTLVQSEAPEELEEEALVEKLREKIMERRAILHKANEAEITARWAFEEAIKRPYFHVKPLEKGQLKMWKEYLEFEIEKGDLARVVVLFERCLIACCLYEEYWIRYVKFLQTQQKHTDVSDRLRDVFSRACSIHHQNKPWINLHWAAFEESQGNADKSVEILERLMKALPDSIHALYRVVNVERRRGNLSRCCELFDNFVSQSKSKAVGVHITIKYAQFLTKNLGDYEKAKSVLQEAVDQDDTTKPKVVMALVNVALERQPVDIELVVAAFDQALQSDIGEEQKVTFAHRKIEFLEEYGTDVLIIEKAHEELQSLAKALRDKRANAPPEDPSKPPAAVNDADDPSKASTNGVTSNAYTSQQYSQYGNYANWNYQQPAAYAGYNQQSWSAYQGYYGQ